MRYFGAILSLIWRLLTGDGMKTFVLFLFIVVYSLWAAKTGDRRWHINTWMNPRIELDGYQFTERPADWINFDEARRVFQDDWCRDRIDGTARECREEIAAKFGAYSADERRWARARGGMIANLRKEDATLSDQRDYGFDIFSLADFDRSNDYSYAALHGAFLAGLNLEKARLAGADLSGAQMEAVTASEADFTEAQLIEAHLETADLSSAKLVKANLRDARLIGALLNQTDLTEAYLAGADLSDAYVVGADIATAQLLGAKAQGAAFQYVEFKQETVNIFSVIGALFGGAVIEDDFLEGAFGDGSVTLPREFERPTHWPKDTLSNEEFVAHWREWREGQGLAWPPLGAAIAEYIKPNSPES